MWISGTRTRTPELHLTSTTVEGNIRNALPHPGTIIAERCKLPDSLAGDPEFRDLGHNIFIQS